MTMTKRRTKVAAVAGLALSLCSLGLAQDQPQITNAPLKPEMDSRGAVRVFLEVTDSKGRGLYGLSADSFEVAVEGLEVKNAELKRPAGIEHGLSVILAIDVSGSMKGEGIAAAKAAAVSFLEKVNKEDACALMTFGEGVRLVADFTRDRQVLRKALDGLEAVERKTFLYQALFEALDRVSATPTSRTAVVLLTDGRDEGSGLGLEDVVAKINATRTPIYALAYGARADVQLLRRVATLSRGAFQQAPEPEELRRVYTSLAEQLSQTHHYLLTFSINPNFRGERAVTVRVRHRGQVATAVGRVTGRSIGWPRWVWVAVILGGAAILGGAIMLGVRLYRRVSPGLTKTVAMLPQDRPSVWLEVTSGPHAGQRFPLREGKEATIGRVGKRAQICLGEDPLVSGVHAKLTQNEQAQFVIQDLSSRNRTRVNDVEISEPLVLQPNDRIQVGLSELLFIDNR